MSIEGLVARVVGGGGSTAPPSEFAFFVPGIPKPGGSKRAFVNKHAGRAALVDMSKNQDWKASVAHEGYAAIGAPLAGPLEVEFHFVLPRPKSHYRTGKHAGELRPDAPYWHTKPADATKLIRSTEDALKGIAWGDDSQIAKQAASKTYGDRPGCLIKIRVLPPYCGDGGLLPAT